MSVIYKYFFLILVLNVNYTFTSYKNDNEHLFLNLLPLHNDELIRIFLSNNYNNEKDYDTYVQEVLNNIDYNINNETSIGDITGHKQNDKLLLLFTDFEADFLKFLSLSTESNFLISPLAVELCFAFLVETATGVTQREIKQVFGFHDRSLERLKYLDILRSVQATPEYTFNITSKVYIGQDNQPRERFVAVAREFYNIELTVLNNTGSIDTESIKQWISSTTEATRFNAEDVSKSSIIPLSGLIFKGIWLNKFYSTATKYLQFTVPPLKFVKTPFMNVKSQFYLAKSRKLNAKILKMPYVGNRFAMYIVLPNQLIDLKALSNIGNQLRIEKLEFNKVLVDVMIPKFKFDYFWNNAIMTTLVRMGVGEAFKDTASFPGVARMQSSDQRLRVTKVLQWSRLDVDEFGSLSNSTAEEPDYFSGNVWIDEKFIADIPFLFFIQDETSRKMLYIGRVTDPTLTEQGYLV